MAIREITGNLPKETVYRRGAAADMELSLETSSASRGCECSLSRAGRAAKLCPKR